MSIEYKGAPMKPFWLWHAGWTDFWLGVRPRHIDPALPLHSQPLVLKQSDGPNILFWDVCDNLYEKIV